MWIIESITFLTQGCYLSPTLFKMYIQGALKQWNRGTTILLFADDYVIVASDEYNVDCMFKKLVNEYQKRGLNT